jgi:hypothetical protein
MLLMSLACDAIALGSNQVEVEVKASNDFNITLSVVDRRLKPWSSQTEAPNDNNITLSVVDRGLKVESNRSSQ